MSMKNLLANEKFRKVAVGALLAAVGAAAAVAEEALSGGALGLYSPLLAMAVSTAVNAIRKALTPVEAK
jgi:hypothetical protein